MENGFYWVKANGRPEWTIGIWQDDRWRIPDHGGARNPFEIAEIGPRVLPPEAFKDGVDRAREALPPAPGVHFEDIKFSAPETVSVRFTKTILLADGTREETSWDGEMPTNEFLGTK